MSEFHIACEIEKQMVRFTLGGVVRRMPFAQFGEFLLNGAPGGGNVLNWVQVSDTKRVGVSSAGLLRIQQAFDRTKVQLPVLDMARYDYLRDNERAKRAWQTLLDHGVIIPTPRKPNDQHQVVIRGVVPARTWEVELALDGLIRDTLLKECRWMDGADDLQQWQLGNVNETGAICWGDRPPVWKPDTTIEDVDFYFLTGSAFNTDWQPAEFQWAEPHKWAVSEGLVYFGQGGLPIEWTFGPKATLGKVAAGVGAVEVAGG